jgi:ATP-dependent DNA helicase DinG
VEVQDLIGKTMLQTGDTVDQALVAAFDALCDTALASVDLRRLLERAGGLVSLWRNLVCARDATESTTAQWMDWGPEGSSAPDWALVQTAVTPSKGVAAWMDRHQRQHLSWVFTSATLGSDDGLSWFTRQMGLDRLENVQTARFASPFHEPPQMALYVPSQLPEPSDPSHSLELADLIAGWARELGGRTLVLTTTVRASQRIAHRLRWTLGRDPSRPLRVLDETQHTREHLLELFRPSVFAPKVFDPLLLKVVTEEVGAVLVASMHQAIRSNNNTLMKRFRAAGHSELVKLLEI